jgi:D-arabinose 1-dehydrogenase-like Zn-dependent alcohol dehydrogenase
MLKMVRFRTAISGSHIGGIASTEEVLELCGAHGILPDI